MIIDSSTFFDRLDSELQTPFMKKLSDVLVKLEHLYAAGLGFYLGLEAIGLRKRLALPVPTISIGNLSVGGTGKTPAVISLGRCLQDLGYRVAVISRGHGGTASRSVGVVSNDRGKILLTVAESGDEPMLLARSLPGIPVLVGRDRRKSAILALRLYQPDLLLLDDGFQFWQLRRDLDIVLVDAHRPFENGHCLPRGLLREPKENLKRAQIVVVTRSSSLDRDDRKRLEQRFLELAPKAAVYYADHLTGGLLPANDAAVAIGRPTNPFAVSAVARPESFAATLVEGGVSPVEIASYPDHHRYTVRDARQIVGKMKRVGADAIVTTEKDSVKLEGLLPQTPIFAQSIQFQVTEPNLFIARVLASLGLPIGSFSEPAASC